MPGGPCQPNGECIPCLWYCCAASQESQQDSASAAAALEGGVISGTAEFYPVTPSVLSHEAASSEENKDKESLRSKLEQIKAIATTAENPNTSSTIINILQEVEKSLDSSHSINFSEINAKLDQVSNMVTLAGNIKYSLEKNDNSAPSTPGEVTQEQRITQKQMDRIIDMSMKLYDIFANNDDLFKDIAKIFVTDGGSKDINEQKQDLREVAEKLEEAKKTTENDKIKEHLTKTSGFLEEVSNSDNSTFIGAVHAAIHDTVNQRQIIELRQEAGELRNQLERERAERVKLRQMVERQAKHQSQEIELLKKQIAEMKKAPEISVGQPARSVGQPARSVGQPEVMGQGYNLAQSSAAIS